jgi:hypothetical protein
VAGVDDAGRECGEPVEGRRAGHLDEQATGRSDPVRIQQGIGFDRGQRR